MIEDILGFEVKLYSPDGQNSPVVKYIKELLEKNPDLGFKSLEQIPLIPKLMYLFENIKHFKVGKYKFYELRVREKNNICRFFFTLEKPNFIVFFGFTKQTQKTEKKDIELGLKYYLDFKEKGLTIDLPNLSHLISKLK
jgi:phage-related protein